MAKYLDNNGLLYLWQKIIAKFVQKEPGKVLSTNDYTTAEKQKLQSIAEGAEVNVNADWTAQSGDAQILNKPTIPSKTSELANDSGFITSSDIPEGAAASTTVPKMDGVATVGTEMAFARGDHIHPKDTSKVDKVEGKGLSTNDYTTDEKNKLKGVATGAQVNVLETIQVNGELQSNTGKMVNINVPTTVAQLSDAGNYALKSELSGVYKYKGSVANFSALPEGANLGDVYNTEDTNMNYAWNGKAWDPLGEVFKIDSITNGEIDNIVAS